MINKGREKRQPIVCPKCGRQMVCMNRFQTIHNGFHGFFVWYVCPRREGETGCGYSALMEVSPKTKRPQRAVVAFRIDKALQKKKRKK